MSSAPRMVPWAMASLFAAISVAFLAPGIFSGHVPVFRDLLVLTIPLRHVAREAVRSGTVPLWTNDLFFGAPFLANYQSGVLYPPSALLYGLPFSFGFSLFLAFHLFVAGWGMSRYVERRCRLGSREAAFAGLVFSLGGFVVSLVSLTNQLAVAVWMPWALEAAEELAESGRHRWSLQLTLVLCLQALGGAPEALLLTLLLIAASLTRELIEGRLRWRAILSVGGSILLAAALAAVQLLPTAEYVLQTDRAEGLPLEAVTAESLAPRSLFQLLVPHTFAGGAPAFVPEGSVPLFWSLYVGIAPIAFAMLALGLRPLGFWSLVLWATVLLSFGGHTPLFPALYHLAPRVFGAFRFPEKFFLASHYALSILAAQGLSAATREHRSGRLAAALLAAVTAIAVGLALAARFAPEPLLRGFGYSLPPGLGESALALLASSLALAALRSAAVALTSLGMLWFFVRQRISGPSLLLGFGALAALDLFAVHQPSLVFTDWQSLLREGEAKARASSPGARIFHYCTRSPGCVPENAPGLGPWSGFLRPGENAERQARALWAAIVPDAPMVYAVGAVAGSDGFSTRQQQQFFRVLAQLPRERALHLLASLGVSRLIGPEPLGSFAEPAKRIEDPSTETWEYELSESAPRAYLAERVFTSPDPMSALERLAGAEFNPGRDAVLIAAHESRFGAGPRGELRNLVVSSARIGADVDLPSEGLWVVGDTWFPGWQASVDGSPAETFPVNALQRGVRVPPGPHHVEMSYEPVWFRTGGRVSFVAAVLLLLQMLYAFARRLGVRRR